MVPDPMGRCRRQKWWKSIRKEGYFFPSYDDDAFWDTVVPAAYNNIHPRLEFYDGDVVYLNRFTLRKPQKGERIFLCIGAVNDSCEVFLNGKYIGNHQGSYQIFTFDITEVAEDENRLLIISNSARSQESVLGWIHDWFHYGGIIRDVRIFYRPEVFVRDAKVSINLDGENVKLNFGFLLEAASRCDKEISFALTEKETGKRIIEQTVKGCCNIWNNVTVEVPKSEINLWSPDNPFLYEFSVMVEKDNWIDTTGLREISTSGKQILLNGRPILLKGVAAWTADERGLFSIGRETSALTVDAIKNLNGNFARAGHCPPSSEFVKECDRRGIGST